MKNSVTTNYRRNSDNSSEQIQRIVIWTEIMIQSIKISFRVFSRKESFFRSDRRTCVRRANKRAIAKVFCDVSRKDVKNKQKVKLKRAQGECLVTGSRRRT